MSDDEHSFDEPAALDEHKEDHLDDGDHKLDSDPMDLPRDDTENEKPSEILEDPADIHSTRRTFKSESEVANDEADLLKPLSYEEENMDDKARADLELIKVSEPSTDLERALYDVLARKDEHISRLGNEIRKLKTFITKRKQTYKRKRKDDGAPVRPLSAYNIFIQDRFKRLRKENETALKSSNTDAQLQRVPPANLVAATGGEWNDLPPEEKAKYEERAKSDKARYEEQMAKYCPPDRGLRRRNKTGYNMFFSAHVLRLKQSEQGVPSERGSVARLVGVAWKALSAEEKQYYEREADKHNGMNPLAEERDEDDDEDKRYPPHAGDPYAHMHHGDMGHYPPPPVHGQHPPPHDPRQHPGYAPYPMYGPPHGYEAYYGHQQPHHRGQGQGRNHQGYGQSYPQTQPYEYK